MLKVSALAEGPHDWLATAQACSERPVPQAEREGG